jgi:hypothetical protein
MDKIYLLKELLGDKRDYLRGFMYVMASYTVIILTGYLIWYLR